MRERLTKQDVEKIEKEIEHRKLVVRKEAIEAVKEARAQGDLSENFEYYAAKNNTVTLYLEDDEEEETYRLVTSIRGNSLAGLISTESPIGKAILGHKVGDRVYIKVSEDYGYYAVIRKIENTQSEDEDKIRSF